MLACYGTEALRSHPGIGKEESEFRMVLHYNMRTILRNGNEFPEKNENIAFFSIGHLGRYLCCFYLTFTFFIGKTDKTDNFQELWLYVVISYSDNLK
jgi:hypothetical protein